MKNKFSIFMACLLMMASIPTSMYAVEEEGEVRSRSHFNSSPSLSSSSREGLSESEPKLSAAADSQTPSFFMPADLLLRVLSFLDDQSLYGRMKLVNKAHKSLIEQHKVYLPLPNNLFSLYSEELNKYFMTQEESDRDSYVAPMGRISAVRLAAFIERDFFEGRKYPELISGSYRTIRLERTGCKLLDDESIKFYHALKSLIWQGGKDYGVRYSSALVPEGSPHDGLEHHRALRFFLPSFPDTNSQVFMIVKI